MISNKKWVSIWGNAMSISENRPEAYGKNITLCYTITAPFSGNKLKLTFDNYCGTEEIEISKAVVIYENTIYPLSFSTKESVSIPAGMNTKTDALTINMKKNDTFEVRFFLADYTLLRSSVYVQGPLCKSRYAIGDYTSELTIHKNDTKPTNICYFLSNISMYAEEEKKSIVCYGDSITAQDWPDYLQLLFSEDEDNKTAIIRRATSGSRILREYDCITYESYGLKGEKRFRHEVPTEGADTVIIQQGINDIIHPVGEEINPFRPMSDLPTAQELIDGLRSYISQAKELGYKVYLGTLLPIEGWRTYESFREDLRTCVNDWIRHTDEIDGFIDFDYATRDSKNPSAFLSECDSGDHLHPSAKGYKKMADIAYQILKS